MSKCNPRTPQYIDASYRGPRASCASARSRAIPWNSPRHAELGSGVSMAAILIAFTGRGSDGQGCKSSGLRQKFAGCSHAALSATAEAQPAARRGQDDDVLRWMAGLTRWRLSIQGKINLFMDMYANIVNPCITAIVINLILFSSENVLDAILNALALNFITEVDEYVLKADLDDAQLVHEQKLDAKIAAFISGDTTCDARVTRQAPCLPRGCSTPAASAQLLMLCDMVLRMAVSYKLSEKAQEGQAARQVFNDDIAPQERMILPFLFMSFAVSFICLTVLVCI